MVPPQLRCIHPGLGIDCISLERRAQCHFIVIGGTWCGDTKRELPKFFKTVSLSHIPESNIELYGVDRSKKSNDGLTEKYGITRVPTFILFSDGKEIGRIVESTNHGMEFALAGLLKQK